MRDIESLKRRLPPPQRNILNYVQSSGEVSAADLEKSGFDKNFASAALHDLTKSGVLKERYNEEKKEFLYSANQ